MLGEDDPAGLLAAAHDWVGSGAPAVDPAPARGGARAAPAGRGRADVVLAASGAIGDGRRAARSTSSGSTTRGRRGAGRATRRRARANWRGRSSGRSARRAWRRRCGDAPVEAVALAGALGAEARRAWLEELRHVRLEISGDDLIAAGVPARARRWGGARARAAIALDGEIAGRDAELAAALSALGEH